MTFSSRIATVLALLLIAGGAATAQAQMGCPNDVPENSQQRRSVAKEWFGKAESAEAGGNDVGAIKAYQCSLKMVPHAFTAFNLARLAEKTGDLELSVESYSAYLKLAPEAKDKAEVETKITNLNLRVQAAREVTGAATAKPAEPAPVAKTPPAEPARTERRRTAPADEPSGANDSPTSPAGPTSNMATIGWVVTGVGVAALVGGIIINRGAQSDMDDCNKLAKANQLDSARSKCDGAKPKAYTSYVLMPLGALAAIGGAYLALASGKSNTEISMAPLSGGAFVSGRMRF